MRSLLSIPAILPLLLACTVPEPAQLPEEPVVAAEPDVVADLAPPVVEPDTAEQARQRLIADTLFEGLQALDDNRLLTPVDDSAHARFARVLAYEPDNPIALQGIQDIIARYVDLSLYASRQGSFNEARLMLEQAAFVDPDHPSIAEAELALQAAMDSDDLFFPLDYPEFARRSELAQEQLAEIALQAREHSAFFLITAPNDELARWMFSIMRQAVDGYRLRGNIELAGTTSVRLRLPGD